MNRDIPSVLILEPNALQCDLIQLALTRHHLTPIVCHRPEDLRQHLSDHLPDVLLVDTHLRGQNGLDLVGEIMSDTLLDRTKIFFISSLAFPEIIQKAAKIGASGFLVKPLNVDLLVARILTSLGRTQLTN